MAYHKDCDCRACEDTRARALDSCIDRATRCLQRAGMPAEVFTKDPKTFPANEVVSFKFGELLMCIVDELMIAGGLDEDDLDEQFDDDAPEPNAPSTEAIQ